MVTQYKLSGIIRFPVAGRSWNVFRKISIILATIAAVGFLASCGSSDPKVTVIGNSQGKETQATPRPSK
jgi:hypothetical protein